MSSESEHSVGLSPLDAISAWMDAPTRPLSFGQILELKESAPGPQSLQEGARSAKCAFARTGSVLDNECWSWRPEESFEVRDLLREDEIERAIAAFMAQSFLLEQCNPIEQLYLNAGQRRVLVTRVHHAVSDGLGLLQWLDHQFQVATGREEPVRSPCFQEPPTVRKHPGGGVRKTLYSGQGPSRRLWRRGRRPSSERHKISLTLDAGAIRRAIERNEDLRLNDALAGACLGAMADWNLHHSHPDAGLSLWHPVNIRESSFEGVGNGSSRVRIYWEGSESTAAAAASVRTQMDWARSHGEWHVPDSWLFRSPTWIRKTLALSVLRRPWVDMGSMLFSHMERQGPYGDRLLDWAERIDWVGMLDKRFPAGFVGATSGDATWLTLCWDPGLWSVEDAAQFLEFYEARISELLSAGQQ